MVNIDHKKIRRHIVTAVLPLAILTMLWACDLKDIGPQNYAAYLVGQVDFRQDASAEVDDEIVVMAARGETVFLIQHSAVLELVLHEDPATGKLEFDDSRPPYALPLGLEIEHDRLYGTRQFWQVFPGVHPTADVRMLYNTQTGDRLFLFGEGTCAVLKRALNIPEVLNPNEGYVFYDPNYPPDTADIPLWKVEITPASASVYDVENTAMMVELSDPDGYTPLVASTDEANVYILFASPPQDVFPSIDFRIRSWSLADIISLQIATPTGTLIELHLEEAPGWEELWGSLLPANLMEVHENGILLHYPSSFQVEKQSSLVAIYDKDGNLLYAIDGRSGLVHSTFAQLVRSSENSVSIMRWR